MPDHFFEYADGRMARTTCQQCEKPIERFFPTKKFCSPACRVQWNSAERSRRRAQVRIRRERCPHCGRLMPKA